MPVEMYNKEGKFCPVDNVLVEAKLKEGYTLGSKSKPLDPAIAKPQESAPAPEPEETIADTAEEEKAELPDWA